MPIERELKFRIRPQAAPAAARLLGARAQARHVESVYFDTPDRQLQRARMALRLRRDGGAWLQTLKAERQPDAGLATRHEWESPARGARLDLAALPRDEIRSATGTDLARVGARLRPVFATRFVRRSALIRLAAGARAELCLDRGQVAAGRRRERLHELELELKSGDPGTLLRRAERIVRIGGLELAFESKAARGYRLGAGVKRAAPQKWRAPELDGRAAPEEAFRAVVSAALAQAGANAAGFLDTEEVEYLHQLRVGLQRLRAALQAFKPWLGAGAAGSLKRRLRRLAPALGAARDWDVFVVWLEGARAPRPLLLRARRERQAARRAARRVIAAPQFQGFLLGALRWLHEMRLTRHASLEHLAADSLGRLHRRVHRLARRLDQDDADARHALRIRIKRLRYASDFFVPYFRSRAAERYREDLESLQDLLGELNDVAVARRLLRRLGGEARLDAQLAARKQRLIRKLGPAWRVFAARPAFWPPRR